MYEIVEEVPGNMDYRWFVVGPERRYPYPKFKGINEAAQICTYYDAPHTAYIG